MSNIPEQQIFGHPDPEEFETGNVLGEDDIEEEPTLPGEDDEFEND